MATREQLHEGIRRAGKAGDAEAVRAMGAALLAMDKPAAFPATVTAMKGVAQGVAGLADLAMSPLNKAGEVGFRALERVTGSPLLGQVADAYKGGLRGAVGNAVRTPANQEGIRSVFEGVGAAAVPASMAAGVVRAGGGAMARALAANPVSQAVAGGVGAGAAEGVRQSGGSAPLQLAAGLGAGLLSPVALETTFARNAPALARLRGATPAIASIAGSVAGAATGRVTDRGVRQGAAQVLRDNATDSVAAMEALRRGRATVSGALPTTAEASRDPGLAGLQRSLGNLNGGGVKTRLDNNTLARQQAMMGVGGAGDTEALRPALEAERNASRRAASRLYDFDGKDELVDIGVAAPNDMRSLPSPDASRIAFEAGGREAMKPVAEPARVPGIFSLISGKGVNVNGQLADDLRAAGVTSRTNPGLFRKSGGVSSADELVVPAQDKGFFRPSDPNRPETIRAADVFDALVDDMRASGRGGAGNRVQNVDQLASRSRMDAQDAAANQNWWSQQFDERGLDPERMDASDWDAMYRDVEGLGPRPVTQDDMRFMAEGAEASGPAVLSPFQSSILDLRKRMFPGNVGVDGNVTALLGQIMRAETVTVGEALELGKALRRVGGRLSMSADGKASGALAKAAANALEGHLSAQSGPALMGQMKKANAAWRDVKSTFDEGAAGRVIKANRFGGDDRRVSDGAQIAQAFSANDKGKALRQLLKASGQSLEAKAALRRGAAEYVVPDGAAANVTAAGDDVQSNLKIYQRLDRVLAKSEMSDLWTAKQKSALKVLRDEFSGAQFAASAERPAGSNTSRDAMTMARITRRAVATATAGKSTVLMQMLDLFDRADDVAAMAAKAMLDPKFAADLMAEPTPERLRAVGQALKVGAGGGLVGAASTSR